MAESLTLNIHKREGRGTNKAQKLRKQGLVPGVLYGHKQETLSVSLSAHDLESAIRHGHRVVDLNLAGTREKAQICDLQWDHLGKEIVHVDFKRVSEDERIHITVRIEVKGVAPGIAAGGILDQPLHTLTVECPVIKVPESIRVNVSELQLGQAIHVKDLTLPPDVKALADPEAIVVHVTSPALEPAPSEESAQAEPEVIGRKAAEEGEAEEK